MADLSTIWRIFKVQTNKYGIFYYLSRSTRLLLPFLYSKNLAGATAKTRTWFVCKLPKMPRHFLFSPLKSLQK